MQDSTPVAPATIETPAIQTPTRRGLLGRAMMTGLATVPIVGYFTSTSRAALQTLDEADKEAFRDIRGHENDHVQKIKKVLGSLARPKPTFKNLDTPNFAAFVGLSLALENTGVGAYLGALPLIVNKDHVAFAGSIALIEARHAGFLNVFSNKDISTQAKDGVASAVDRPLTIAQVVAAAGPYIASLNGGPPASFTAGDDVSIVNFALLLEYLEAEYYNINIPKYF